MGAPGEGYNVQNDVVYHMGAPGEGYNVQNDVVYHMGTRWGL